jgi:hypothetical protein
MPPLEFAKEFSLDPASVSEIRFPFILSPFIISGHRESG